jgi:signal transduction histidine kinase
MKERARDLGGSLTLENAPDGGACLRLVVPAMPEAT